MKKKRNVIILVVTCVLGIVAALLVLLLNHRSTLDDFAVKNPETITRIFMANNRGHRVLLTHDLENTSDSAWMVDEKYYASQPMIEMLVNTMASMRIREKINRAALPNVVKDLSANNVKVEVYQMVYRIDWFKGKLKLFPHEKKTVTYYVGHETRDMMGSYILRDGDKEPYVIYMPGLRGMINTRFIADPIPWRSHRIMKLDVKNIERVELDIAAAPDQSYSVVREGEGFYFECGEPRMRAESFDTARVAQMLSSFTNLNFDEYAMVVPKVEIDSVFSKAPKTVLTVTDRAGNRREVKTYVKYTNPDDLKAMPDTAMYQVFDINRLYAIIDSKDTVLIQYFVFDNILQPASFFLGNERYHVAL